MNTGKTLFAQLMDFLPWTTFTRIVEVWRRSPGPDAFLRRATWSMAFAQLTYRESLRDIEPASRPRIDFTWAAGPALDAADANERRDWRIHAALAQRLITQARTVLYVDEELGLDLTNTVYALDSTTSL